MEYQQTAHQYANPLLFNVKQQQQGINSTASSSHKKPPLAPPSTKSSPSHTSSIASSMTTATCGLSNGSGDANPYKQSENLLLQSPLRDNSSGNHSSIEDFDLPSFQKKKKKKKDHSKKKKKSKKSSKRTSPTSSLLANNNNMALGMLGEGGSTSLLRSDDNSHNPTVSEIVWGDAGHWGDNNNNNSLTPEEWDAASRAISLSLSQRDTSVLPWGPAPPKSNSYDTHDTISQEANWTDGVSSSHPKQQQQQQHQPSQDFTPDLSQSPALASLQGASEKQKMMSTGVMRKLSDVRGSSDDEWGMIGDILECFGDDNMSILTGSSLKKSTIYNNYSNPLLAATKLATAGKVGGGPCSSANDRNEVSHELIVNYMLAMGANRETATELAFSFADEQQQQLQKQQSGMLIVHPPSVGRRKTPAVTLTSKSKEAQYSASQFQPRDVHSLGSFSVISQGSKQSRQSKQSKDDWDDYPDSNPASMSAINGAKMVEAMPVRDIESDLPLVFAESTPLSLKYLAKERPVRRLFCIAFLIVFAAVISIIVYFTAFKKGSPTGETTVGPTMAPSFAPTFISNDILVAAAQLSGFNVLDDSSPQLKAVGWMSTFDQIDTGGLGSQAFAQRYALVVMYYSFEGTDWINQENWLSPDQHECEWSNGIVCGLDETNARVVTGFDATRNNLQGTLPPEIGLLSSSETFRIPKNSVRGTIPDAIGKMTSLSVLDLCENEITGAIPSSLDSARDMILLDLSRNQLGSTIPVELYRLQFLRTLVLTTNQLTGTLHPSINNLSSLVTLDLRNNHISGSFPVTLDSIASLEILRLDRNRLTGSLPEVTNDLVLKQTLGLSHNQFSGNIGISPSYVFSTNTSEMRLQFVDLSYNLLAGTISPLFGFLPTFRYFDLSGNAFAGTFPSAVGWDNIEHLAAAHNALNGTVPSGYPTLTHLDMSNNYFSEGIPEDFCTYQDLEFLILSGNPLNSTIPACLGDSSKLRDLELRNCSLTGTIPPSIGQLSDLSILHMSDNILSNMIPTELGGLTSMKDLQLQGNALMSPIPSQLANMLDLNILNLTDNLLIGTIPFEFGALLELESLILHGNVDLRGEIPSELCDLNTLKLLARDIGCNVACGCCSDAATVCELQ